MYNKIRKLIVKAAYEARHGHIPSAFSIVELLTVIHETKEKDDVFILSKGHACLALYAYLTVKGIIDETELINFGKKGSILGGHPDKNKIKEIYASTGSLGHGLPIAVGSALAKKLKKNTNKVFCIIGDGEANEGTIWESLAIASKLKLNNLYCIVDNNKSQNRSMPSLNLFDKFKAFGWEVIEIDGHDDTQIIKALTATHDTPVAIIANTIKGKGLLELESNTFAWHHKAPSKEEFDQFIQELNEN